jgi:hypothetical protein
LASTQLWGFVVANGPVEGLEKKRMCLASTINQGRVFYKWKKLRSMASGWLKHLWKMCLG